MKQKVQKVVDDITGRLAGWNEVDAISMADSAEKDVYDPYFFISFDVYHDSDIPDTEKRKEIFSDGTAFESARNHGKDRFLIEDIPVRIEYKKKETIEDTLQKPYDHLQSFLSIGTYGLYRLAYAESLYEKTRWLNETRETLQHLGDEFWKPIQREFISSMGHALSDVQAAVLRKDNYFFIVSASAFLRKIVSLLFIINREFEPSGRGCLKAVLALSNIPENFNGRFESFLRQDGGLDLNRKAEVAELMAKSIVNMT